MEIKHFLEKQTAQLCQELSELLTSEIPKETRCIEFIIFEESLPFLPFAVNYLNRFQGNVTVSKAPELLANIHLFIDSEDFTPLEEEISDCLDLESELDQNSCIDSASMKHLMYCRQIADWISTCWEISGGRSLDIAAFIVHEHGQFNPINLKSGQHIKHLSEYKEVFDG